MIFTDEKFGAAAERRMWDDLPICEKLGGLDVRIYYDDTAGGLRITRNGQSVEVRCSEGAYIFRALGLLCENIEDDFYRCEETAAFSTNGVMVDCSRNAVPKIETLESLVRKMALMGLNTLLLYVEDTYQIPDEPYFGYMRGGYSADELRSLDDYASSFGIEVIPCIQTLAHLKTMLKLPAYADINDLNDIMLVDDERTYALIEKMIRVCRDTFATKRIHIGMDEAHLLGRGKYLDANTYESCFALMCRHLSRVAGICRKYGCEPMIWSDMFFRLANGGDYYGVNPVPEDIQREIPGDVSLVYWDYYGNEEERYDRILKRHAEIQSPVAFAGGSWKWNGYLPYIRTSLHRTELALNACRKNGIKTVFTTAWGDDGADAALFSILPVIQQQAELNFAPSVSEERLETRFRTCADGELKPFFAIDASRKDSSGAWTESGNYHKYMLFQDLLTGLFDKHVPADILASYKSMKDALAAADRSGQYGYLFDTVVHLLDALMAKAPLGTQLKTAYDAGDRQFLQKAADEIIPDIMGYVREFRSCLERQWMLENKPFGFETQDIRIGGLLQRLDTVQRRLRQYLEGQLTSLEELEVERLPYVPERDGEILDLNVWSDMVTPSILA